MRHIAACSLVFFVSLGVGGCGPALPSVGELAGSSKDGGAVQAPESSPPTARPATVEARPDAGAPERSTSADARDTARDGSPDAAKASDVGARAPRAGEIVVDELLVDPAGNDLGHEWIEIANVTREPLDVSALRIADEAIEISIDGGVLPAGGLLVLGQSADRAHNGDAPVDLAYGTRLALNNGADRIALCLGPCATGVALDTIAWTAGFGEAYVAHAVVLERGGVCPAEVPYGDGENFGSPGRANPPCLKTVAEPTPDGGDVGGDGLVGAPRDR